MKILFIYCENVKSDIYKKKHSKPLYSNDQIPFGIAYLTSSLEAARHEVFLIVLEGIEQYLMIANYIKKTHPQIYLVAGGPHISLFPEEAINTSLDILSIGEGEDSLVELMNHLEEKKDISKILGIWSKRDGQIYRNPTAPFNCDLDRIPYPNRELWLPYIENTSTPISVLLGRGCYFNCTYCSNHVLKTVSEGRYVRYRSVDNILGEIAYLVEQFPNNDVIYFETEAINCDFEFMKELCTRLKAFNEELPRTIYYGTNVRITPNMDWNAIFKMFRKANISYVNVGLESGSNRVRTEVMKRFYSNDDVLNAMKAARKYRIRTMLYVMLGLPTETLEEYEMTIEMVRECKPSVIHMSIFYPYPGTDLYKMCAYMGLIDKLKPDIGRNKASLDMPQFTRKQIQKAYDMFYPRIYARTKRELYYFYFLIKLGEKTGIRYFNHKVITLLGNRQVSDINF